MTNKYLFLLIITVLPLLGLAQRTTLTLTDAVVTTTSYTDKEIVINGKTELHVTNKSTVSSALLKNSIVQLNSANSWIIFDNVRPQFVIDSLLRYVYVNGQAAALKTNVRVSFYKHGAVVVPHASTFQPLKVFTGQNFTGDSTSYSLYTYNNALGTTFDNKVRSFKLKRGYMATLATSSDGLGYSRVFIADDADLEVAVMPALLDQSVSFIRVFSWEYVTKKGWCGTNGTHLNLLNSTWCYDWSAYAATTTQSEYVPMRAKLTWAPFTQINALTNVTHSLGFNEPDHPEQHQDDNGGKALTVAQALAQWPDMLKSGLRVGAPACTDFSWLYAFMDSCKARNYRVDYVAVHAYWGAKSPANWYNDLKYIHQKTGRPIWITEWNNGANWTTETWPTTDRSLSTANAAKQLSDMKAILNVLDTASFIERYSIYNWVQDCRAVILADTLTPAGKYYAADNSVMAFNRKKEVIPGFIFGNPTLAVTFSTRKLTLTITDPNAECLRGFILEKKINNGAWSEYYRSENSTSKQYVDTFAIDLASRIRYRVKSILVDGTVTGYSNETGYDVTGGYEQSVLGNFQYGTMSFSNSGWNPVYFKQSYSAIPAIVTGAATNNNTGVLVTPRVKLVSASSRFNGQVAPWAYQTTALSKDERIPYFVAPVGEYDLGTLKMKAGKVTVLSSWTPVVFATAFDSVPVVFANQLNPSTTNATTVRIRNVTKTGFEAKLMKETAVTTALSSETVTYVAVSQGKGVVDNKKVVVGSTADSYVGSSYRTIYYDSIAKPIFLSQMQTCNDDTVTAALRNLLVSNKYAVVLKQRERSTTATYMLSEKVGWMVIDSLSLTTAIDQPSSLDKTISIYPNPVRTEFFVSGDFSSNDYIELYNTVGVLLKQQKLVETRIDVSDLKPGCYIVKLNGGKLSRIFIKI